MLYPDKILIKIALVRMSGARGGLVRTGIRKCPESFPQLCKWNGFTIDTPRPQWEDDRTQWENFCHSRGAVGEHENKRTSGNSSDDRQPVPHSAESGFLSGNYRRH